MKKPMRFSPESVTRIIDAVGPKYVPDTLNARALWEDLNVGFAIYGWISSSAPEHRSRKEKADQIVHHAQELLSNLRTTGDQMLDVLVAFVLGRYKPDAEDDQPYNSIIEILEWLVESLPRISDEKGKGPMQLYITVGLASYYRKHFKREPGYSRPHDGGPVGGPFVRFAEAVCDEAGTKVTTRDNRNLPKASEAHGYKRSLTSAFPYPFCSSRPNTLVIACPNFQRNAIP